MIVEALGIYIHIIPERCAGRHSQYSSFYVLIADVYLVSNFYQIK